jgi:hypothetical protein
MSQESKQTQIINANRRAGVIADLTALSLMIDHGLVTVEEVSERLQLIQRSLSDRFHGELETDRIAYLADVLRSVYGEKKPRWTPQVIEGRRHEDHDDEPSNSEE